MIISKILRLPFFILAVTRVCVNLEYAREFRRWYQLYKIGSKIDYSFSQSFEDLLLLKVLPPIGSYLDVGAHHPLRFSNTYRLYSLGWRGVNIDANPNLLPYFDTVRTKDKNICAAVGSQNKYQLSIFDEPLVSSVDNEFIVSAENAGYKKLTTVETQGMTLRFILEKYFPDGCDLLLLDIEGSELDAILSGDFLNIDSKLLPRYVLLEEDRPLSLILRSEEFKCLTSTGYELRFVLPTAVLYTLVH